VCCVCGVVCVCEQTRTYTNVQIDRQTDGMTVKPTTQIHSANHTF